MKKLLIVLLLALGFSGYAQHGDDPINATIKLVEPGFIYGTESGGIDSLGILDPDNPGQWKLKNVSDPVDDLDAVNKKYVNDNLGNVFSLSTSTSYGGEVSINILDSTKINITAGSGFIVDAYTDPENPVITQIDWSDTILTDTGIGLRNLSFITVTKDTDFVFSENTLTREGRRDTISLATNLLSPIKILATANTNYWNRDFQNTFVDFVEVLGVRFNDEGNVYSANGANRKMDRSGGSMFGLGLNYLNKKDPNYPQSNTNNAIVFFTGWRDPSGIANREIGDTIPVYMYDPDGDGVLKPIPEDSWTVHRVGFDPVTETDVLQYGQFLYDSQKKAEDGYSKEDFVPLTELKRVPYRCALGVPSGAAALNQRDSASFINISSTADKSYDKIPNYSTFAEGVETVSGLSYQRQSITFIESGGTIYLEAEKIGGGDITYIFAQREFTLNCTSNTGTNGKARIALLAGADDDPRKQYVYVTRLGETQAQLNLSESLPTGEYADFWDGAIQSVPKFLAYNNSPYVTRRKTDAKFYDERGALSHERERLRVMGAYTRSSFGPTPLVTVIDDVVDSVKFDLSSGIVYQLNRHTSPSLTTNVDSLWVLNDPVNPWGKVGDINEILTDATGATLNNKCFNFVFVGVINTADGTVDDWMGILLPTKVYDYNKIDEALGDFDQTAVTSVPSQVEENAYLLARVTFRYKNNIWENLTESQLGINYFDLRGDPLGSSSGGVGTPSAPVSNDNTFEVENASDATKKWKVNVGDVTTANTRTVTIQDQNGIMALQDAQPFTQGSVLFADATGKITEDNTGINFDPTTDDVNVAGEISAAGVYTSSGLKIKGDNSDNTENTGFISNTGSNATIFISQGSPDKNGIFTFISRESDGGGLLTPLVIDSTKISVIGDVIASGIVEADTIASPTTTLTINDNLLIAGNEISTTSSPFTLLDSPTSISLGDNALNLTVGSASGSLIARGDFQLQGGDIVATTSTASLYKTTPTQIDIGSASSLTYFGNNIEVEGEIDGGFSTGSVLFGSSGNIFQNNAELYWNNSFKALGIGTIPEISTGIHIAKSTPLILLENTGASADYGLWNIYASSTQFIIEARNDAGSAGTNAIEINRTGANVTNVTIADGNDLIVEGNSSLQGGVQVITSDWSSTPLVNIANLDPDGAQSGGLSVQAGGNSPSSYSLRLLDKDGNIDLFVAGDGDISASHDLAVAGQIDVDTITSPTDTVLVDDNLDVNGEINIITGSSSVADLEGLTLKNNAENGSILRWENQFGDLVKMVGTKMGGGALADDGKWELYTAVNSVNTLAMMINNAQKTFMYGDVDIAGDLTAEETITTGESVGQFNSLLDLKAGNSGLGTAKVRYGTANREWELGVDATPYDFSLDYIGTDTPLPDIIKFTKDGNTTLADDLTINGTAAIGTSTSAVIGLNIAHNVITDGSTGLNIIQSSTAPTSYGAQFINNGAASFQNRAAYFSATNGVANYAIYSNAGLNYFADNVGIRTTTPTNTLTVATNTVDDGIDLRQGDAGAVLSRFGVVAPGVTNNSYIGTISNNSFLFYTNGSEVGRFSAAGSLGVDEVSPAEKLDVNGNARFQAISSGALANDVGVTSDGTLTTNTSDSIMKMNVVESSMGLAAIEQLRVVNFDWKPTIKHRDSIIYEEAQRIDTISFVRDSVNVDSLVYVDIQIPIDIIVLTDTISNVFDYPNLGIIAQEAQRVDSSFVFTNSIDGMLGVHKNKILYSAVNAIKHLKALHDTEIDSLSFENAALRTELDYNTYDISILQVQLLEMKAVLDSILAQ